MSEGTQPYDCAKAFEELDAFVRGELPLGEAERMRVHLDRCGGCAKVARFEQAFRERLAQLPRDCCPDALRQRIADLLSRERPDAELP